MLSHLVPFRGLGEGCPEQESRYSERTRLSQTVQHETRACQGPGRRLVCGSPRQAPVSPGDRCCAASQARLRSPPRRFAFGENAARLSSFQKYTVSMDFVRAFERQCGSQASVKRLRAHPAYHSFHGKWNLPVYFQIRSVLRPPPPPPLRVGSGCHARLSCPPGGPDSAVGTLFPGK